MLGGHKCHQIQKPDTVLEGYFWGTCKNTSFKMKDMLFFHCYRVFPVTMRLGGPLWMLMAIDILECPVSTYLSTYLKTAILERSQESKKALS